MSENILSRYEQAQAIWQASEGGGMRNDLPLARWIDGPDGPQFWYKRATKAGAQFRLVSAATGANEALFDHAALAQASGEETDPEALPLRDLHISVVPTVLKFTAFDQEWQYAVDTAICSASEAKQPKDDDSDRDFFYSMLPTHHNLLTSPDGTKAAEEYYEEDIEAFRGKLFLIAGGLSETAVASTMRLVEALQKANKNFDMLILLNLVHSVSSYSLRREWDFLVRHLQGVEPPCDFRLISGEIYEAVG